MWLGIECYGESSHEITLTENDPELRALPCDGSRGSDVAPFALNAAVPQVHVIDALMEYYSSFHRVKKALSWLGGYIMYLKTGNVVKGPVSVSELSSAEHVILMHVQHECYREEIEQICERGVVSKSNHLAKLCPKWDNDLLVVGGRLCHAGVPNRAKSPIILPKDHRVSTLICQESHDDCHVGTEWVLSQLRRRFWIIKARSIPKKIRRNCIVCKRLYAKPSVQRMADLPPERLDPCHPPFTIVGVDVYVFGPFSVVQGCSSVKRYGCVYSCFGTRAIHFEVMSSMDTDAFINGFVRFFARISNPTRVWSDNGTNIVGARMEFFRSFRQLDRSKIICRAQRQNVEWSFNPPHASHHGGLWEQMIWTIRQILVALLVTNMRLTDDVLHTVMCEVENLINSHPLTKCSDDVDDDAPLTQNHHLLNYGAILHIHGVSHTWVTRIGGDGDRFNTS